jgi:hypothetical protein
MSISSRIRARRRARRSSETGASAIEFALVAGIFFTLIIGIIDFSLTMFDLNATSSGAREGAHDAAELIGTTLSESTVCAGLSAPTFSHSAANSEDDNEALRVICRTKNRLVTVGGSRSRVQLVFEDIDGNRVNNTVSPAEPYTGIVDNSAQNIFIVVCVQTKARSITGLFTPIMNHITFMARARERLEFSSSNDGSSSGSFHIPRGGETFFDTSKTC